MSEPLGAVAGITARAAEQADDMNRASMVSVRDAAKTETSEYVRNEEEKACFDRVRKRAAERGVLNRIRVGDRKEIQADHPDLVTGAVLQMDALGLSSYDGYAWFLNSFVNAITKGPMPSEVDLNGALSFVKAMKPRDDLEALLLAQMAATHNLMMTFARRLNHVDNIAQQDSAERAFNKLARTFAAQMEALKRYRSTGQQQILVQRVNVNDGGQAIVGTVNQTPGGVLPEKTGEQPHALGHAASAEMLGQVEAEQDQVPVAGGPGP